MGNSVEWKLCGDIGRRRAVIGRCDALSAGEFIYRQVHGDIRWRIHLSLGAPNYRQENSFIARCSALSAGEFTYR
ncbi:hypothetical protein ACFOGI_14595 [Virgibacillus xinjiangensis]|uniref:Uncharacterized protein n=1 Tax=Virgibacillus xinjiangensis TaxID=393090 RepID=A0ABV7CZ79_9BACI